MAYAMASLGRVVFFCARYEKISTLTPLTVWIFAVAISPPNQAEVQKPLTLFQSHCRLPTVFKSGCFLTPKQKKNKPPLASGESQIPPFWQHPILTLKLP